MPKLTLLPLNTLGAALAPDTDHLLRSLTAGSMLLIHLPPGDYAFEQHATPEYIVCLSGVLRMADAAGAQSSLCAGLRGGGSDLDPKASRLKRYGSDWSCVTFPMIVILTAIGGVNLFVN